jgi:hypothetical protein
MDKVLKDYSFKPPSAGINVHTSRGPAQAVPAASDRMSSFFFRSSPIHTPGSGDFMKGTPRITGKKKRLSK